jgi:hypothetical protein
MIKFISCYTLRGINCKQNLNLYEAVSKACHPAPDAGSPRKKDTGFQGIAGQAHNDKHVQRTFETASYGVRYRCPAPFGERVSHRAVKESLTER